MRMKNRSLLIAIISLSLILGLATGFHVFYSLFLISSAICILSIIWAYFNTWGLNIEYHREYSDLRVGNSIRTQISLHNKTIFPKLNLSVTDLYELSYNPDEILLNIPAHKKEDITLTVLLEQRGVFSVRGAMVKSIDPLDLSHISRGSRLPRELIVFPKVLDIPPFSMPYGEITGEGASERTDPLGSTSISTIREYQPGDSTRNIHWPSTARTGKIILKQFDSGKENILWIMLDMDSSVHSGTAPYNTEEFSIIAAASIAHAYFKIGWAVGLICHGNQSYVIHPQQDKQVLDQIMIALATIGPEGKTTISALFAYWEGSLSVKSDNLVVITPNRDPYFINLLESPSNNATPLALVIVESDSFNESWDKQNAVRHTAQGNLPIYSISKDDDIKSSLSHPYQRPN